MDLFIIILILIVGSVSTYLCKYKNGSWMNIGSFYCALWTIIGSLANSGYYEYYHPATIVNVFIVVSLLITLVFYVQFGCSCGEQGNIIKYINVDIKYRIVFCCNVITFIYQLPIFVKAIKVINSNGYIYLRTLALTGNSELGTSNISALLLQSIFYPLIMVTIYIGFVQLFLQGKNAIKVLLMGLINLTLYCFSNASRNGFVVCIVFLITAFFKLVVPLHKEGIRLVGKKHKFLIAVIIAILIFIIVYLSKQRSGTESSFIENMYLYFVGGPSYMTSLLNNMSGYKINYDFLWGMATFGFIYNIFALGLKYLGIQIPISDYIINSQLASKVYSISPNVKANAMSTIFFSYLMDWGYLGIVIGPILFIIVSIYVEKKSLNSLSIRWTIIGIYWYYVIYRTIFKWDGVSISFFFVFYFIWLFTYKEHQNLSCEEEL